MMISFLNISISATRTPLGSQLGRVERNLGGGEASIC